MTTYETRPGTRGDLPAGSVFCAESLSRTLLAGVSGAPGDWARRVPLLGRHGRLPAERRRQELAREAYAEAVPHEAAAGLDVEAIAEWIVGHYRASTYPSVLLGSPHGAAAHLAVALGAAWLPTSIPVTVTWPGGSAGNWPGALAWGAGLAAAINDRNPSITVRQVHDPMSDGPLCGTTVRLHLRWHMLPAAYEKFLRTRIAPGGCTLLLRDLRAWPVVSVSRRYAFQIGSPVSGVRPADYCADNWEFRHMLDELGALSWVAPDPATPPRYAERSGEPVLGVELGRIGRAAHRVLYARPEMLSAGVADLLRKWRHQGRDSCVVECGRLLDPWQARAAGLVPYWCESASSGAVEAAEWWLGGSPAFDSVTVLPGPPGFVGDRVAPLAQWRSLVSFGRERGSVDRLAAGRYPGLPLATHHATRMLAGAGERPPPPPMTMTYALSRLHQTGGASGLLVR
ncbi:hypothetical protein Aab01nite_07770 [Paractinoplanes abujensis]|uniref:Uncharacterized protein n=1 Tax=Paractinoplanes abujensis TaxID=882441 RepID=A0A7W7CQF3_9ACTN|nr:hypothetical protein [Actinoplanes abujensis]MBB4691400.1 hypothetical protein [Actinoplanes abujensis]GID17187.1 hypothetical protein Aab01nite_07770 [Actinoplanes abujensis]